MEPQTKHQSHFIHLKGINRAELQHIMDFLYNGVAYISQEELNNFLETAQELQVKGLQINQKNTSEQNQLVSTNEETETLGNQSVNMDESIMDPLETVNQSDSSDIKEENYVLSSDLDLDLQIDQMIEKNEGQWQCRVCSKRTKLMANMKHHAETQIKGVTHTCHICNKTLSKRESLRKHVSDIH